MTPRTHGSRSTKTGFAHVAHAGLLHLGDDFRNENGGEGVLELVPDALHPPWLAFMLHEHDCHGSHDCDPGRHLESLGLGNDAHRHLGAGQRRRGHLLRAQRERDQGRRSHPL